MKFEIDKIRLFHRFSSCLIFLFILIHTINHIVGIFGQDLHIQYMDAARKIYRNPIIEFTLIILLLWQIFSGSILIYNRWKNRDGLIAWLQILSGLYLLLFIINHVIAVFYGRYFLKLDTNFNFAAAGFHAGDLYLFFAPYYFLAIFALFTHIGCALYWIFGNLAVKKRNYILIILIFIGFILSTSITLSLAGKINKVDIPPKYIETYIKQ